jgi:probable rRNA maturation factor
MSARFHEQNIRSALKDKKKLSSFLDGVIKGHNVEVKKVQLNYIFCTDEFLLQMNQQYLDHDTLTDIITFDLSEKDDALNGEIYVSIDRVRENAEKFKVSYAEELHRVIFHGALHLCGFKDKTKKDAAEMRRQEDICLNNYNNF